MTIISVPSSLNSSHNGFISSVAVTLASFECSPLFGPLFSWDASSLVGLLGIVWVPTVSRQAVKVKPFVMWEVFDSSSAKNRKRAEPCYSSTLWSSVTRHTSYNVDNHKGGGNLRSFYILIYEAIIGTLYAHAVTKIDICIPTFDFLHDCIRGGWTIPIRIGIAECTIRAGTVEKMLLHFHDNVDQRSKI